MREQVAGTLKYIRILQIYGRKESAEQGFETYLYKMLKL